MLRRLRNVLFDLANRSLLGFAAGVAGGSVIVGIVGGLAAEMVLLTALLGWLAWEVRPKVFLALGLHERAAVAARSLALEAGPCLRGDLHHLTEAVARLSMGDLARAKRALSEVDPERLPDRGRYAYFLDFSVLFLQLGDGETALAMVDASQAEAETLSLRWPGLGAINRSAALCEMGRFDEAALCLGEISESAVPPAVRAYFHNNLAWGLGLGSGDKERALRHAELAAGLRHEDPACLGTLGMCLVLAGHAPEAAVPYLERAMTHLERRSPLGRAMLLSVAARTFRCLEEDKRADDLELELAQLPRGEASRSLLARALEGSEEKPLLPLPEGA